LAPALGIWPVRGVSGWLQQHPGGRSSNLAAKGLERGELTVTINAGTDTRGEVGPASGHLYRSPWPGFVKPTTSSSFSAERTYATFVLAARRVGLDV